MFVIFLLGDSPSSEFYVPTFRNTVFRFHIRCLHHKIQKPGGGSPKIKNTTFRIRRKFEIKNFIFTVIPRLTSDPANEFFG